jgi:hypothetical protein
MFALDSAYKPIALALAAGAFVAWSFYEATPERLAAEKAAVEARLAAERAVAAEQKQEAARKREAQLAPMRKLLCDDAHKEAAEHFAARWENDDIFVDPIVWFRIPLNSRQGFAGYWSVCWANGRTVHIRLDNTGREVASFTPDGGYSGYE